MRLLVLLALLSLSLPSSAQQRSCGDPALPAEHRWNPKQAETTVRLARFYDLDKSLSSKFNAKEYEAAATVAQEYLKEAAFYRCNWEYGNAIHDANIALGMAALHRGEAGLAGEFLVRAGASPGSPQLDTFGPTLVLADALLASGDAVSVVKYLQGIQRFWRMDNGAVKQWLAELSAGRRPDFSMHVRPL